MFYWSDISASSFLHSNYITVRILSIEVLMLHCHYFFSKAYWCRKTYWR